MDDNLANTYSALPYLVVIVLCLFAILVNMLQRRFSDSRRSLHGRHASWRVSEIASPRFWHVSRDRARKG